MEGLRSCVGGRGRDLARGGALKRFSLACGRGGGKRQECRPDMGGAGRIVCPEGKAEAKAGQKEEALCSSARPRLEI